MDRLGEEKSQLLAIQDGVAKAVDGVIRFRGRALKRKDVGAALRTVEDEMKALDARIVAHEMVP